VITSVLLIALPVCFGNWTANALVTERILQITFFCVLLIWQNVVCNQKANSYLKEIADFCGIKKNLTTHAARHTFATTVTLANNVPLQEVSAMLGHASTRMTQHYARVMDRNLKDNMNIVRSKMGL